MAERIQDKGPHCRANPAQTYRRITMLTPAEQKKLDTLKTKHVDGNGKFRKKTSKAIKDMIKHLIGKRDQPEHVNCRCDPQPVDDELRTNTESPSTDHGLPPVGDAPPMPPVKLPKSDSKQKESTKNDPTLALRPKKCPEHLAHLIDQGFTYIGVNSHGWHYVKNANDLFRIDEEKGVPVPKRLSALSGWTPKLLKNLLK